VLFVQRGGIVRQQKGFNSYFNELFPEKAKR